jgi:ribosomal-protein-alanine N-acetyltransferase
MLDEISDLHKLCFPHKPWSREDFSDLKKSGCEIIASQHGFIVWRVVADQAEIITVGVHPEHRGAGIGSALLALMEQEVSKSAEKVKIFLEVAADNQAAVNLYKKSGYAKISIRRGYYDGTDAILMEKNL